MLIPLWLRITQDPELRSLVPYHRKEESPETGSLDTHQDDKMRHAEVADLFLGLFNPLFLSQNLKAIGNTSA